MRFLNFLIFLIASVIAAELIFTVFNEKSYTGIDYGGVNQTGNRANLRERADASEKPIAFLPANHFVTFLQSGKSGQWHYIRYSGNKYVIHRSKITLGYYRLLNRLIFTKQDLIYLMVGCSFISFVFFIIFLRKKNVKHREFSKEELNQELTSETIYKNKVIHQLDVANKELSQYEAKLGKELKIKDQNHKKVLDAKNAELESIRQEMHRGEIECSQRIAKLVNDNVEKEKLYVEKDFQESLEYEAAKLYEPKISEMERSYNELQKIYDKTLSNAIYFDADFNDPNFESILKGRKFEIFIASFFEKKMGMTILEWTPDKGFLSGNQVQSNMNPDLYFESKDGKRFAVECKYRGGGVLNKSASLPKMPNEKKPSCLSWASCHQPDRYFKYGKEKKVDVWIAIAYMGEADDPENIFFLPLSHLHENSVKWPSSVGAQEQWVTPLAYLETWVEKMDFSIDVDRIFNIASPKKIIKEY